MAIVIINTSLYLYLWFLIISNLCLKTSKDQLPSRIKLDGKVENTLNQTLKSIIWQNYLSSKEDDVSVFVCVEKTPHKEIFLQPSKIRWMEDDSVNSFVNLELRKEDMESYIFGQEGNLWNNIIFKVDCHCDCGQKIPFPRWTRSTRTAVAGSLQRRCRSFATSQNWLLPNSQISRASLGFLNGSQ